MEKERLQTIFFVYSLKKRQTVLKRLPWRSSPGSNEEKKEINHFNLNGAEATCLMAVCGEERLLAADEKWKHPGTLI